MRIQPRRRFSARILGTARPAYLPTLVAVVFLTLAGAFFSLSAPARAAAISTPTPRPTPTAKAHATSVHTPVARVQAPASPLATPAATRSSAASSAALIAKGRSLYTALGCSGCHSLPAIGAAGTFGPSHQHVATNAAQRIKDPGYTGNAKTPEEYLHESIVSPDAYEAPEFRVYKYAMPSFKSLSDADVDALVAFLMQQK